jgi:hypothetical protein
MLSLKTVSRTISSFISKLYALGKYSFKPSCLLCSPLHSCLFTDYDTDYQQVVRFHKWHDSIYEIKTHSLRWDVFNYGLTIPNTINETKKRIAKWPLNTEQNEKLILAPLRKYISSVNHTLLLSVHFICKEFKRRHFDRMLMINCFLAQMKPKTHNKIYPPCDQFRPSHTVICQQSLGNVMVGKIQQRGKCYQYSKNSSWGVRKVNFLHYILCSCPTFVLLLIMTKLIWQLWPQHPVEKVMFIIT